MNLIQKIEQEEIARLGKTVPEFSAGDTVVVNVTVKEGDSVRKGKPLLTIEAMKMQTTLQAEREGKIGKLLVKPGSQVENGDLLLTLE